MCAKADRNTALSRRDLKIIEPPDAGERELDHVDAGGEVGDGIARGHLALGKAENVIAGPSRDGVRPRPADDRIVSDAAVYLVLPLSAGKLIVAPVAQQMVIPLLADQ